MDLAKFADDKMSHYAQKIIDGGVKVDEHAVGEMTFYITLRRVLAQKATLQDVGMLDAINDVLQELGLVESGKTFYKP